MCTDFGDCRASCKRSTPFYCGHSGSDLIRPRRALKGLFPAQGCFSCRQFKIALGEAGILFAQIFMGGPPCDTQTFFCPLAVLAFFVIHHSVRKTTLRNPSSQRCGQDGPRKITPSGGSYRGNLAPKMGWTSNLKRNLGI